MALSNTATPIYYGRFREAVMRGEIPVCREISMEMNRIDDLIANPGVYYDDKAVNGFIKFCERELTLTDGSDLKLLDSFKLWAEEIFGWYYFVERSVYVPDPGGHGGHYERKRIKKRLITKQYLIITRAAAKTMYLECLQAYFMTVDKSTTQQVTTAPTMKQAEEVLSPFRTALARARGPVFKFMTMELMEILKGEYINPHVSIFYYKLDSIDEVGKPEMWLKANPNLGQTVSYETYQLDVERAENSPGARNDILAKRFNLPMEGYTYFFTYEETLRHRHRDFWQMPCAMGADLSLGDDFCSFTFLFPLENGYFGVKTRDYITSYTLSQLPLAMRQKYEEFMNEGTLQVFDGTVLDMMQVYDDLDAYILQSEYDVRAFGYDPYNAKEFVERWAQENGPFGIEKVIQGARTESVPLGELKKLSEQRKLLFDEALMEFAMGNCITLEDTNGNRKLYKQRHDKKIDAVAALMDAYVAWKLNRDAFE